MVRLKIFISFTFLLLFVMSAKSMENGRSELDQATIGEQIDHYNQLTQQYASINLDSSLHFHEMAHDLAVELKDDEKIWEGLSIVIEVLFGKNAYEQAKIKIDQAFSVLNLNDNPRLRVKCLLSLVIWNWKVSNLAEAQKLLNEARAIAEEKQYWKELGDVYKAYLMICVEIPELNDQKSEVYSQKAIEAYQHIKDTISQALVLNAVSFGYILKADYPKALAKINLAFQLVDNNYKDHNLEMILANKAEALIGLGQISEGIKLIEEGLQSAKSKNNAYYLSIFYEQKVKSFLKLENYKKAIELGLETLKITNGRTQQNRLYANIAESYKALENHKQSFYWTEKSIQATEELLKLQKKYEVVKLQAKYQVEKKEAENQVLALQNKNLSLLVIFLIVFSLVVIIFLLTLFRNYQNKKLEEVRQNVATDLKKDVGTKLAFVSSLATKMQSNITCPNAKNQLGQLVKESNLVIQNMTDVIWALDNDETEWKYLIEKMEDYLQQLKLTNKNIKIAFERNGLNESKHLPLNVRHHLLMIFKEAINNIQKHTIATLVKVELDDKPDSFCMNIRNEFSERIANSKSTGRGLMNIKRRMNELNGEVSIKKEEKYFDLTIHLANLN